MSAAFNSKKSFRKGELKIEKDLMCYDQVGDWIQNANWRKAMGAEYSVEYTVFRT